LATLHMEPEDEFSFSLQIEPVPPDRNGRLDAYRVVIRDHDEVLVDRVFPGEQCQMGHYYLTNIGLAFQQTQVLVGRKVFFTDPFGRAYERPVCVLVGSGSLDVYLYSPEDYGNPVIVADFLVGAPRTSEARVPSSLPLFYAPRIWCSVEAAEQFGAALLAEVEVAEQQAEAIWREIEEGAGRTRSDGDGSAPA
jgi:hypothetical protein